MELVNQLRGLIVLVSNQTQQQLLNLIQMCFIYYCLFIVSYQ